MEEKLRASQGYSDSRGVEAARVGHRRLSPGQGPLRRDGKGRLHGNGVSELISLCMQALLDAGDEILIPSPDYPLWTATATLAGGTVVHYHL